jgi:aspartyl-tRNA(Asn)/glutamyl-tRNA(Gln) amidotransferase subunit C
MSTPSEPPESAAHPAPTVDPAHLARLSRLALSPDELATLTRDLGRILGYVDTLKTLDLAGVPPTSHPLDLHAGLRPDEPGPTLPRDAALAGAPSHDGQAFIVPKVV